jgi:exodeoxyribonuclease VII small subunit
MKNNVTFEEAMRLLDDAVSKLESGALTLDESLATFEEAVKLIKVCNEKINSAEQKVKMLIQNADGSVSDAPFDVE